MNNKEIYSIAGVKVGVESDWSFPVMFGEYKEYQEVSETAEDYNVKIVETNNIEQHCVRLRQELFRTPWSSFFLDDQQTTWQMFVYQNMYLAALTTNKDGAVLYHLGERFVRDMAEHYGYNPLTLIGIEEILIQFETIILHSCHIQYQGKSILFSAPSGVGKSTQGGLWEEYLGAEVINGDRTAINVQDSVWTSHGIPMCGTSGIHKNKKAPLGAIIFLEQASENSIVPLSTWEKFQHLYQQTNVYDWEPEFVDRVMTIIEKLLQQIPVYLYRCTKEPEAAYFLKSFLQEEHIIDAE